MMELELERDANGKIIDYISGIAIQGTPEEVHATQVFSMHLVESLGYRKSQIITRPQHRVAARPSDEDSPSRIKSDGYPIDIAVFDDTESPDKATLFSDSKNADDLRIVVECKAPDRKEGKKQLQRYLSLSSAEIGVWFNGNDSIFIQKTFNQAKGGAPVFKDIPSLPKRGQAVATIGKYKRNELQKAHNLKSSLVQIRNFIAGNSVGTTRDEAIATEIINLIFCKLHDEKTKASEEMVDFRAQADESAKSVAKRIKQLFTSMKTAYKAVFTDSDKITLDDESILYVVGLLQQNSLLDTERDVVADAFEVFIGPSLKGAQGQFFTPRNAVALAIQLLNINENELVIDPACGSGGFLVETLARKWAIVDEKREDMKWDDITWAEMRNKTATETIFGVEKDAFLAKVAKAYMAIMGDGRGGIFCENTLAVKKTWKSVSRMAIWGSDETSEDDPENKEEGKFDVVVANPPYGEDIRITAPADLEQYTIAKAKGTASKKGVRPDILFIERCLQLLKPGGRMAIVLIETFFHAPDSRPVLDLLRKGNNITWIVDLPHNTFRPHCNAKTVIVVLEKGVAQGETIGFAVGQQMGHDHRGEPMYRRDASGIKTAHLWDDLAEICNDLSIERLTQSLKSSADKTKKENISNAIKVAQRKKTTSSSFIFRVKESVVRDSGVYVPRYHWADAELEIRKEAIASATTSTPFDLKSISDLINDGTITHFDGHGSPDSHHKGTGDLPYIRVDDISGWSIYKNPVSGVPLSLYSTMVEEPHRKALEQWHKAQENKAAGIVSKRKKELTYPIDKRPSPRDILFVRRGSYRIGSVAIVSPYDGPMILTREILTLRVNPENKHGITPEYLLFALAHPLVQRQMPNKVLIDTTLPNIGDRWRTLLLPIFQKTEIASISKKVESGLKSRWEGDRQISELSKQYGKLVL